MLVKDESKVIINLDDSYYQALKLRRESKRKEKKLESQIVNLNKELDQLKELIHQKLGV